MPAMQKSLYIQITCGYIDFAKLASNLVSVMQSNLGSVASGINTMTCFNTWLLAINPIARLH